MPSVLFKVDFLRGLQIAQEHTDFGLFERIRMDVLKAFQEEDASIVLQLHKGMFRRPDIQAFQGRRSQNIPRRKLGI
jgi:hypothetical protein